MTGPKWRLARTPCWRSIHVFSVTLPFLCASAARAEDPSPTPDGRTAGEEIVIIGRHDDAEGVDANRARPAAADAAKSVALLPGAAVVDNGAISGQLEYRGLFGPRMDVRIDGAPVTPGGPNWMDPPLHYAPRPLLERVALERGIASVRSSAESIGGSARAELKRSAFREDDATAFRSDVNAAGHSADRGFAAGGLLAIETRQQRLHVLGSVERGGDIETPDGRLRATRYERASYGAGYGLRLGEQELALDYRRNRTRDTGTPALPMDIRSNIGDLLRGSYRGAWREAKLSAAVDYASIDHVMDNFSVRPDPAGAALFRRADASSDALGFEAEAEHPLWGGQLAFGADGRFATHDMRVTNPNAAAFFVTNFDDVERNRYGAFAQWRGKALGRALLELGVRYTRVATDAGPVDALPAQLLPPAMRLRDAFNAADRRRSEDNLDWVAKLEVPLSDSLELTLAAARKTRSPSYIERYAWIPLEVTGGLADGNNYVGDIGLDREHAYDGELGAVYRRNGIYLAPRAFFRRVRNYIQGTPSADPDVIAVSTLNGDPTPLQFSNVDAELYGFEVEYGAALPLGLQLDGTLSYVRGKRRDVDDDLYRIAPLRGRTTLSYRVAGVTLAVEGTYADYQRHVSRTNGETTTGGYGLLGLFAHWQPDEAVELTIGIDNVLDATYRRHVSGINRVSDSAVPIGERLLGAGRNAYGRITWRWQ